MIKSSDDETYEVEKIVGKKVMGSKVSYRVKWKGYPAWANSWEPLENLTEATDAIRQFEGQDNRRRHKRSQPVNTVSRKPISKKAPAGKTQKTQSKRPKILLPSTSERQTHWVFGNRLKKVMRREGPDRCRVLWDDSTQSVEHLAKISWYEPELLSAFLNKEIAKEKPQDAKSVSVNNESVKGEPHA